MKKLIIITAAIILAFVACKKKEDPIITPDPSGIVRYEVHAPWKAVAIDYLDGDTMRHKNVNDTFWFYEYKQIPGKQVYLQASAQYFAGTIQVSIFYKNKLIKDSTLTSDSVHCPKILIRDTLR